MGRSTGQTLTDAYVKSLVGTGTLYRIPDAAIKGLEVQVTANGVKSWVVRFRVHGKQRSFTIGRCDTLGAKQAKKEAKEVLVNAGKGIDACKQRREQKLAQDVSELVTKFKEAHLPTLRQNSKTQYTRILDKRVLPALGSIALKDIQPSDIATLQKSIEDSTRKGREANLTVAILLKMFNWAEFIGIRQGLPNPAKGQRKVPEEKRDRHLSDRELIALGVALRHLSPTRKVRSEMDLPAEDRHALAAIKLALLTGMRKSEIIGDSKNGIRPLKWSQVDFQTRRICIKQHKTSKKTGLTRYIALCEDAVKLLKALPKVRGNDCVIPGGGQDGNLVGLPKIWGRIKQAVHKLQKFQKIRTANRVDISDVTIHDLRRSFASLAARRGYAELIVAALLGHSTRSVTAGYARIGEDPLLVVADEVGSRMQQLLMGNVDLAAEAKARKLKSKRSS